MVPGRSSPRLKNRVFECKHIDLEEFQGEVNKLELKNHISIEKHRLPFRRPPAKQSIMQAVQHVT
ncbi:protein of unknown function [Shinella sp. WSC3-e]|nr:hypothetical protein SHINE37_43581 [Rhizobiaceae bacterium]CAK7258118.1 protein of unknown function [Shinella sp. WSC3-e]